MGERHSDDAHHPAAGVGMVGRMTVYLVIGAEIAVMASAAWLLYRTACRVQARRMAAFDRWAARLGDDQATRDYVALYRASIDRPRRDIRCEWLFYWAAYVAVAFTVAGVRLWLS